MARAVIERGERLEKLSLLLGQRARQHHVGSGIQITGLIRLADLRHSLTLQPEHLSLLCCRRDLQSQRATRERRDFCVSAKDRLETIGERILIPEEILELLLGHRSITTRPAHVHVPSTGRWTWLSGLLGLLVEPPVGAELVVLLALLRIAKDLVCLVDLLE